MIWRQDESEPPEDLPPVGAKRSFCSSTGTCHPAREVEEAKRALLRVSRRPYAPRRKRMDLNHPLIIAAAILAAALIIRRSPTLKAAVGAAAMFAARTAVQKGVTRLLSR